MKKVSITEYLKTEQMQASINCNLGSAVFDDDEKKTKSENP